MFACSYLASVQSCWLVAVQVSTEVVTKFAYLAQTHSLVNLACAHHVNCQELKRRIQFPCTAAASPACQKVQDHALKSEGCPVAGPSPLDQGQDPGPEVQGAAEATAEAAAGLMAETIETGIEDAILAETTADQASLQFVSLQMLVSGSQARLSAESCSASHS